MRALGRPLNNLYRWRCGGAGRVSLLPVLANTDETAGGPHGSPIGTRDEYQFYLEADRASLEVTRHRPRLFGDEIRRFDGFLRAIEYDENCHPSLLWAPYRALLSIRLHRLSTRLGFTIPPHVFGPGLAIAHRGTIVVNACPGWARQLPGPCLASISGPGPGPTTRPR